MQKFNILVGAASLEINANEYTVWPKTNNFTAADGTECATTSGKGKSAVPNHYIYFRHGGKIFYFKADAQKLVDAKAHFELAPMRSEAETTKDAMAAVIIPDAEPVEAEAPKARRRQRSAA